MKKIYLINPKIVYLIFDVPPYIFAEKLTAPFYPSCFWYRFFSERFIIFSIYGFKHCLHAFSADLSRITNKNDWHEARLQFCFDGIFPRDLILPFSPFASVYQLSRIDIQGFEVSTFDLTSSNRFGRFGLNFKRVHGWTKYALRELEKSLIGFCWKISIFKWKVEIGNKWWSLKY